MTATEYVVDVLGGPRVFRGRELPTASQMRDRVKEGLPFRSLESVRARLRLSVPEAASVLQMPARTLARLGSGVKDLALFNIAFNAVLIPFWSFRGAAIATVATELLNFIILYKMTDMKVSFGFLWKPIVSSVVMAIGLLLLPDMHLALLLMLGAAFYGISLSLVKGIAKEDLRILQNAFKKGQ